MRDVVVRQVQLHQDLEVLERVTVDLLKMKEELSPSKNRLRTQFVISCFLASETFRGLSCSNLFVPWLRSKEASFLSSFRPP